MADAIPPFLDGDALLRLSLQQPGGTACTSCATLVCPGWESLPGAFDRTRLRRVATLRRPGDEEPTLTEYHPAGTHAWSAEAPIAPGFFPYNRCEVWQCSACARPFLRYTEYGGYYEDDRIRALHPALVHPAAA